MKNLKSIGNSLGFTLLLSLFITLCTGWNVFAVSGVLLLLNFIPLPDGASFGLLGYCPYLLKHIRETAGPNNPADKITSPGYLLYLSQQTSPNVINEGQDQADGTVRELRIKYRNRPLEADIQDEDNCEIDGVPVYKEATVALNYFSKYTFFLDDAVLRQYCDDAVKTVMVGKPATPMMQEHLGAIYEMLNAFYGVMDKNLVIKQASNFGMNIVEGDALATAVNINKDSTINPLDDGLTKILADISENEFSGTPWIVGSGIFNNFNLQQFIVSANQAGLDSTKFLNRYKWLYDRKTATHWGANQVGVFADGAVRPLYRNKYVGGFGGKRGESFFFTMSPDVTDSYGNSLRHDLFKLDVQMKFIDCPQTITVNSYGGTMNVNRGWYLIFSKAYDQFNIPADAYLAGDPLYQVNGTLRYTITNNCETCD